jgi:hypothetical protein
MIKRMILLSLLMACTSCSEFALLTSGGSVAISHNTYAKVYGGLDFLTIINTDKDIKTHFYESVRYDDK